MTFWATLWYAGYVAMTIGFEGQTLSQCETIAEIMMIDIMFAYEEPNPEIQSSMFPENNFAVTCEKELLPIDEKYQ